jgi:hypothetical protein
LPRARSVAARGQSPFCFAKKVTQKGDPGDSLISCGARNARDPHKSPDGALPRAVGSWCGSTTALCSAPRSESTGTPFGRMLDRFAMGVREPGCEHPGYVVAREVMSTTIRYKRVCRQNSSTCTRAQQMRKCSIKKLYARSVVKTR